MRALFAFIFAVALIGCQTGVHVEAPNAREVRVTINDLNQDRGGQTTEAVNPEVQTGDVGIPTGVF